MPTKQNKKKKASRGLATGLPGAAPPDNPPGAAHAPGGSVEVSEETTTPAAAALLAAATATSQRGHDDEESLRRREDARNRRCPPGAQIKSEPISGVAPIQETRKTDRDLRHDRREARRVRNAPDPFPAPFDNISRTLARPGASGIPGEPQYRRDNGGTLMLMSESSLTELSSAARQSRRAQKKRDEGPSKPKAPRSYISAVEERDALSH